MPSTSRRPRSKRRRKKFVPCVSSLEKTVLRILRELGLKPKVQHHIYSTSGRLRGVFDFYFPKRKIALEVNGTFWHADPREWPEGPKYRAQKRAARSWKKKVRYAATRGIEIRVVWEIDLAADPVAAIKKALQ